MHSKTYAALVNQAVQIETRIVGFQLNKTQENLIPETRSMLNLTTDQVSGPKCQNEAAALCRRLWDVAQFPPERTRGNMRAQLHAIDVIARLRGFIR